MKPSKITVIAVLAMLAHIAAPIANAGQRGGGGGGGGTPPAKDTPVVTTISDGTYNIQSDGLGSYFNGVNSVISILQSSLGDLEFDEYSSSSRKIFVNLNDPASPDAFNPFGPIGSGIVRGRIIAKASLSFSGGLPAMQGVGTQILSQFSVGFRVYSTPKKYKQYRLAMNPSDHPGTDPALITCTSVTAGTNACSGWHIEPSGVHNGVQKNLAVFEDVTDAVSPIFLGYYYVTFSIQEQK